MLYVDVNYLFMLQLSKASQGLDSFNVNSFVVFSAISAMNWQKLSDGFVGPRMTRISHNFSQQDNFLSVSCIVNKLLEALWK